MSNIRLKTLAGPVLEFAPADLSGLSGCKLVGPNNAEYDERRAPNAPPEIRSPKENGFSAGPGA